MTIPFANPLSRALLAVFLLTSAFSAPAQQSTFGGLDAILGNGGQSSVPGTGSVLDDILNPGGGTGPGQCLPNGAGSPCGLASGPASQPASGTGQNVGAGNPINVLSGNKYQVEVDLPPLPGVLGLEIVRHYNSQYARPNVPSGILGRGWKLSYETDLYVVAKTLQIVQADGTRILFSRDPQHPDLCATDDPARGQIRIQTKPQGDDYVWVWPDGRRLFFNHAGKLTQIVAPTGEFVTLTRDPAGMLLKVTDPQGRSLVLSYADRRDPAHFHGVRVIDSPVGRFAYAYGSTLPAGADAALATLAKTTLVRVTLPAQYDAGQKAHPFANRGTTESAVTRAYHYESARHPTLLTGISVTGTGSDGVPMQQRLSTWAYDDQARAILSVKGALPAATPTASTTSITASPSAATTNPPLRGLEQVNLDFSTQGRTILTNSLGQQTTYRSAVIAGEYRLLEALGPGCATCGPTNVRYRYDARGRLLATTTLDARGQPLAATQVTIDAYSRPLQETRYTFVKGKPVAQGWVRYDYAPGPAAAHSAHSAARPNAATDPDTVNLPDPRPTRITRPSVVAGKVHEIITTYNAAGQPLTVTERGFAPALPALGVKVGKAGATNAPNAPTPISRTMTYTYQTINGRSLLKEIDGPLPNGPRGDPEDSDVTRFEWDKRGNTIGTLVTPGNFISTLAYDEAGRIARVVDQDGFASESEYAPDGALLKLTRSAPGSAAPAIQIFKFDALRRPTETGSGSDADKTYRALFRQAFDTADRLQWRASALGMLEQNRYDSEGQLLESGRYSNTMARTVRYAYDSQGRLSTFENNQGRRLQLRYDTAGLAQSATDSLGRTVDFSATADQPTETGVLPTRVYADDFGRRIASFSPDTGFTRRTFDAANRLIAMRDALGQHGAYAYDPAGRIVRQTLSSPTETEPTVTRWHYAGRRLVALDHPAQSERYQYDARGLRIASIVTTHQPDGSESHRITRYHYDATGTLRSIGLPDGSALNYERNGQGQVVAVKRNAVQTPWLQWLAGETILAKDIERDLIGVKRYVTGNGIEALYRRSRQGVLAQIVYRNTRPTTPAALAAKLPELLGVASAQAAAAPASPKQGSDINTPGAISLPDDPQALLDQRYLWDTAGNLLLHQDRSQQPGQASYAYDRQDRLIASVNSNASQRIANRYFYDAADRRVLAQEGIHDQADLQTNTRRVAFVPGTHRDASVPEQAATNRDVYDASGQPSSVAARQYTWDNLGQLIEVRDNLQRLATYRYNHRGERIAKVVGQETTQFAYADHQLQGELDARGQITRLYLYLADRPLAVVDTPKGTSPIEDLPAWQLAIHDLATIVGAWFGQEPTLSWLHVDHLGAPEAATDAAGSVVWRASYAPFGAATLLAKELTVNLRRPGQYEDHETGLFYNGRRYYDPQRGQYLTPDPLGNPDGPNPYAYVRFNPLRFVDPNGLILFAFDGTGNDESDPSTLSNVVRFRDLYSSDDATNYYITGPGTRDPRTGIENPWYQGGNPIDVVRSLTGKERIARLIEDLQNYSSTAADDTAIDIDIVGFSRGAAEARDFANQIVANTNNGWYRYQDTSGNEQCQQVNFRFMGLFDTVLSTHTGSYALGIPDEFAHVSQAVALNEYRGNLVAFPVESILQGQFSPVPVPGQTRIEMGFLGSHSDIGGGFPDQDIAKVALVWMVRQAEAAGVNMNDDPSLATIVANPVIHDKSSNLLAGAPEGGPTATSEDRVIRFGDGSSPEQRTALINGMSYEDTVPFINYKANPNTIDSISGTVDAAAYLQWLDTHGYNINMTVR